MQSFLDARAARYRVPGLRNLGNTCFFNSILQALASTDCFREYLRNVLMPDPPVDDDEEPMIRALPFASALLECLEALEPVPVGSDCYSVAPERLNSELCQRLVWFRGRKQQDSQELLQVLMNFLEEEQTSCRVSDRGLFDIFASEEAGKMSQSSSETRFNKSIELHASNPLFGLQFDLMRCSACGTTRPMRNRRFLDISLSFADDASAAMARARTRVTLNECIQRYLGEEVIPGVECSVCTLKDEICMQEAALAVLKHDRDALGRGRYPEEEVEELQWQEDIDTLKGIQNSDDPTVFDPSQARCRALRDCYKQLQFARYPDVLCFHFNRKVYQQWNGCVRKVETQVQFPLTLDMSAFVRYDVVVKPPSPTEQMTIGNGSCNGHDGSSASFRYSNGNSNGNGNGTLHDGPTTWVLNGSSNADAHRPPAAEAAPPAMHTTATPDLYELVAVILHHGNERGGHFTTFRRVRASAQWFYVSDDTVREVSESQVLQSTAYMLFYERKSDIHAISADDLIAAALARLPYETPRLL